MRRFCLWKGSRCLQGFALAVTAVWSVGCGSNSPSPDAQLADTAFMPEGIPSPYCTTKAASAALVDMSGTWFVRAEGSQVVVAPTITPLQTKSIFYMLVSISQVGTAVSIQGSYCDRAEVDDLKSPVKVVIPAAWAHTETPVARTGSFIPGVDGVGVLTIDTLPEVAGATLADPAKDPLPTDPITDGRVVDSDNDGNPGITVSLTGLFTANLYSVQRQITSFLGIPVAADRVEGTLTFVSDQTVLGSTNPTVTALYQKSTSGPDPVACHSTFAMVRVSHNAISSGTDVDSGSVDGGADDAGADGGVVGGGAIHCDWVRANEAVLFP